jgi:alanyl-tRNA synthetase
MKALTCQEIREKWIKFFTEKTACKHLHIPSASLVPENPTLLLNSAGMVQFVPIFMGTKPAPNPPRAITIQKCARVGGKDSDLENIGRTTRHHSFFEMLGNFSFGDYFKKTAIEMAWAFVTSELGMAPETLYVSVFKGDEQNSFDQEAYDIWFDLLAKDFPDPQERQARIWKLGRKDNFWGPPGKSGPCGPCSEIYFDKNPSGVIPAFDSKDFDDRFVEIWNLVFMEYLKDEEANFSFLDKKNIDTGAGLERIATILQGVKNSFETNELFAVLQKVADLTEKTYSQDPDTDIYLKIITDHLRCLCFLISDGVRPSNVGRGYVLRMIIRRASRFVYLLTQKTDPLLYLLVDDLINSYAKAYPELKKNRDEIYATCLKEEQAFAKTISNGLGILAEQIKASNNGVLDGEFVFDLYSTHGFPFELTNDIAEENNLKIDLESYEKAKEKHSQISNTGAFDKSVASFAFVADLLTKFGKTKFLGYEVLEATARVIYSSDKFLVLDQTPFYAESGGQLADRGFIAGKKVINVKSIEGIFVHELESPTLFELDTEVLASVSADLRNLTRFHHSACHLLQSALRKVLGDSVRQMGSQVGPDLTRFDFNLDRAMTKDEIKQVEKLINDWILLKLPVSTKIMSFDDAVKAGALSFFEDKYEDEVRVLIMGDSANTASVELCGGTHVSNTAEIAKAIIVQEGSVAAGIRRIKLLTNSVADAYEIEQAESLSKQASEEAAREKAKQEAKLELEKEFSNALLKIDLINKEAHLNNSVKFFIVNINEVFGHGLHSETLKSLSERILDQEHASGNLALVFFANYLDSKLSFLALVSDELVKDKNSIYNASNLVRNAAQICGGNGGGRPNSAQAGAKDTSKVSEALNSVKQSLLLLKTP